MPFDGSLISYGGKLSGPRKSVSTGIGVKHPVVSNVPIGYCTVGKSVMGSWRGRTGVLRPAYLEQPMGGHRSCKLDLLNKC